ncbi:hypothetical protein [Leyella stercorea]|nr:hypothetical protein [Leyella stercorea]
MMLTYLTTSPSHHLTSPHHHTTSPHYHTILTILPYISHHLTISP